MAIKHPYVITVPRWLSEAINKLADTKGVNAGDITRSVMLLIPNHILMRFPDPGDNARRKKGQAKKQRLQMRLPGKGIDPSVIRRSLAMAVYLSAYKDSLQVNHPGSDNLQEKLDETAHKVDLLKEMVTMIFDARDGEVIDEVDAKVILGFYPSYNPDKIEAQKHFRLLARVFHPDGGVLSNAKRMAQINSAWRIVNQSFKRDNE